MKLITYPPTTFLIILFMVIENNACAQEKKVAPTSKALYNEIAAMDSILFSAYNAQDLTKLKLLFTEDLEWFQDDKGLMFYKTVLENFETIKKKIIH